MHIARILTLTALVLSLASPGFAGDDDLAKELLDSTDDMYRGSSSHGRFSMHVKTDRWERTMSLEAWSKGQDMSLMIIRSPAKEAGTATLKVEDNIWNYLPKVDRTMKVPASMMSGSWMGSHFSNDDLVKESRMAQDYTYAIVQRPGENGEDVWVVDCTPRPDAPVVWGKVVVRVRKDKQPLAVEYWDEKGTLKRTMKFLEVKVMDGVKMPTVMRLEPADRSGEFTEVIYEDIKFNVDIPDSRFSLQGLRNAN